MNYTKLFQKFYINSKVGSFIIKCLLITTNNADKHKAYKYIKIISKSLISHKFRDPKDTEYKLTINYHFSIGNITFL